MNKLCPVDVPCQSMPTRAVPDLRSQHLTDLAICCNKLRLWHGFGFWFVMPQHSYPSVTAGTHTRVCVALFYYHPRMEHSGCPWTAWIVVNICHNLKNRKSPLISSNGTIFYSVLYCNLWALHSRLKHVYSVISVIVDSLPGNTDARQAEGL